MAPGELLMLTMGVVIGFAAATVFWITLHYLCKERS